MMSVQSKCAERFMTVSELSGLDMKHDCDLERGHTGPHYCKLHDMTAGERPAQ